MVYILLTSGIIFLLIASYSLLINIRTKLAYKQAKDLENSGKLNEAVAEYEKALQQQLNGELLWGIATLHEKMGRKEMALQRFREIVRRKKYPSFAGEFEVNIKIGVLLFNLKRDENAFEVFIELYKTNKNEQLIIQYLILIAFGQRRYDIASVFLNKLTPDSNNDSKISFLSAIIAYEKRDYLKANKMINKAIFKTEEDDWKLIFIDGITNYLLSKWSNSIKSLEKILHYSQQAKVIEIIYQIIARCNIKMKYVDKGLLTMERAYVILEELYPGYNCESILEDMLFLNIKQESLEKALSYADKLLDKNPNTTKWETIKLILSNIVEQKQSIAKEKKPDTSIVKDNNIDNNRLEKEIDNSINPIEDPINSNSIKIKDVEYDSQLINFIKVWETKDVLGDIVWEVANLNRDSKFDINRFLNGSFFIPSSKNLQSSISSKPFCSQFFSLGKKGFLDISRQIIKKLNFSLIDEKYSNKDIFLAQGDGIDYTAFLKGNEKEKFLIQIRRWQSDSIGELVIKDLANNVKNKKAKQGIFITTGELSQDAINFVEKSNNINIIQKNQLELLLSDIISTN